MSKKIYILGAGYAGIETALTLHKHKKNADGIEIYIIDKNPHHVLLTELHEIASNRIAGHGALVELNNIFKYTDVKIIQDCITDIDFANQKLTSESKSYSYDYLVIGTGSEPNFFGIPGMKEYSLTLWSFEDALKIKKHIIECFRNASNEMDPQKRKSLLTFVIGGGGFTGVEMAGELAHWVKDLCKEYDILCHDVNIILLEALPKILSNLSDKNIDKATNYMRNKLNIDVQTGAAIVTVNKDSVELKDGRTIKSETIIWTAGVKANNFVEKLDIERGKASRVKVDDYTRTQYDSVYSVGDASLFTSSQGTLPALVEAAIQTGAAAGKNILANIRGKEQKKLNPKLHGVMVSIGSYYAVAELMGIKMSSFFAIAMKYLVNMHYLFGVAGFEQVIKYIKDEFLHKQHKKNILERHYSVLTPAFWIVPLRIYLGVMWLLSGIDKINYGWLQYVMLAGSGTDATTGASMMKIVTENLTPSWYAWIADNIIIPNAQIFQYLIVATEVGLGLAFISGTFTFFAALASIGMNLNFILSTGLNDYWFLAASIPMLGGAGRAFGLDHYIIPYLMRQWRYFARNKGIKLWI